MTDINKILSYDNALQYFDNIDDPNKLRELVAVWLIKNENNPYDNVKTYRETYSIEYKHTNKINFYYNEFCFRIITDRSSLNYDELTSVEVHSIKNLIAEEKQNNSMNYNMYHVYGELEEFSNNYYLLASFIKDKEAAKTFIENYKKHNSYVKVHTMTSCVNYPPIVVINKREDGADVIKPNPFTYKSFLKNVMKKTDDQITYLENSFEKDVSRYITFKKIGMEEEAGIFYNVMKSAKDIYTDVCDDDIIEQLRTTIPRKRKDMDSSKNKVSEVESDRKWVPIKIPRSTRNTDNKKTIDNSDEEITDDEDIIHKNEEDEASDAGEISEVGEDEDNKDGETGKDNKFVERHDDGILPDIYKINDKKVKLTPKDMKIRLKIIYKHIVKKEELVKEMDNISNRHKDLCSMAKMLLCYNIFLYRRHHIKKMNLLKSSTNAPSAPIFFDIENFEVLGNKVEYISPFGWMYDSVKRKDIPIGSYGYKDYTLSNGDRIPKVSIKTKIGKNIQKTKKTK